MSLEASLFSTRFDSVQEFQSHIQSQGELHIQKEQKLIIHLLPVGAIEGILGLNDQQRLLYVINRIFSTSKRSIEIPELSHSGLKVTVKITTKNSLIAKLSIAWFIKLAPKAEPLITRSKSDDSCSSVTDILQPMIAREKFFKQNINLILALQFLAYKDLAKIATTSKTFHSDSLVAAQQEARFKKMLSLGELTHFAKLLSGGQNGTDFMEISPYLNQITNLNLSNSNFDDSLFKSLGTLTKDIRQQITTFNLTNAHDLSPKKLQVLLTIFSPDKINHLDFTGSNYKTFREELIQICAFKSGQGTLTSSDGDEYVGQWLEGNPSGEGTMTFANGEKYVGQWLEGNPSGEGTMTFANGDKYVGQWLEAKPSGEGTMTFANREKYVGQWLEGKESGQGTLTFANGGKYVGQWIERLPSGEGTMTFANGSKYVGQWLDGKQSGQGTLTSANGGKYVGQWIEGLPSGEGTVLC
jgi:hypothetical protein